MRPVASPDRALKFVQTFPRVDRVRLRGNGLPRHVRNVSAEAGLSKVKGVHHVGLICKDLKASKQFYVDTLGLTERSDRPDDKLPYGGAWLNLGTEMVHLMEVPNPDEGMVRPEHGGRDRHFCIGVAEGAVAELQDTLNDAGIKYTASKSGRPAIFFRDPDENTLEVVETADWR